MAKLVLLEARRRPAPVVLDVEPPAPPSQADGLVGEAEADSACLDRCLARLDQTTRSQITAYYTADGRGRIDGRKRLAAALGVSATALRLRMLRLRFALEQCMHGCLGETVTRNVRGPGRTTP
jgi:DNA-directed RNA polymerase specialized sigma24 family protein